MKLKVKQITGYFVLLIIISIGLYDIWAFNQGGTQATVSWFLYEWSYKYPAFPFAFGFICGHLFWQMVPPSRNNPENGKIEKG